MVASVSLSNAICENKNKLKLILQFKTKSKLSQILINRVPTTR